MNNQHGINHLFKIALGILALAVGIRWLTGAIEAALPILGAAALVAGLGGAIWFRYFRSDRW